MFFTFKVYIFISVEDQVLGAMSRRLQGCSLRAQKHGLRLVSAQLTWFMSYGFVYLAGCLCVCLSVRQPICPSVRPYVCLYCMHLCVCMYVRMYVGVYLRRYGWVAGWTDGWMHACMHARMPRCMDGCMDGWVGGWVSRCTDVDVCMHVWKDRGMHTCSRILSDLRCSCLRS